MTKLTRRAVRSLAVIIGLVSMSAGATYASFTSNNVNIAGNTVTTGQANLKLCDVSAANSWGSSISPSLNLAQIIPNEERELFPNREIHVGNDNGHLTTLLGTKCTAYNEAATASNTPLRLQPNVVLAAENCPDPMGTNIRLRFELNGVDTGYKTLNSWVTNTTQFDPLVTPGNEASLKAFAQLSSTASNQQGSCTFTVNLTGKQASS